MAVKEQIRLERADFPEQVGVSSKEIGEMIKDFKENNIEVHSIMIMRDGKVAYESWAEPYSPDFSHAMYSVSKSFTSTAVGFAVEEGLLGLDTRLIDVIPEYKPAKEDPNLELLNVHHLLSMQSGKDISVFTDKSKNHWIEDFINGPWKFTPGSGKWQYISENQYMLCVMLTKVTGMSVTEYLTPRLFEPLGIDVPFWEHDINGIEAGGWGMFLKTEDLAKFITCYQHDGMFNGKQVIPANWVRLARMHHAENSAVNSSPDGQCGYGYCFWHCGGANAYRADGMFSQFGIIMKDIDASFIITSGEIDEQKTRDAIWRHFPKCLINPRKTAPKNIPQLAQLDDFLPQCEHSELEKEIEGRKINLQRNLVLNMAGFPTSMLPFPVTYMSGDRAGNIDDVVFNFSDDECTMNWTEGDEENTIACGMDGKPRQSKIKLAGIDFTAISTAAWVEENVLEIHMRPIEAVCMRGIKVKFEGNKVYLSPFSQQPVKAMADNIAKDLDNLLPPVLQPLQKAAGVAFDMLPGLVDSTLVGKFAE